MNSAEKQNNKPTVEAATIKQVPKYRVSAEKYPFRCPVCKSTARDGAMHHDHILDFALESATKRLGSADIQGTMSAKHRQRFDEAVVECFRFPPTLICRTCNSIEGNLESHGVRPSHFSLNPEELNQIYLSGPPNYKEDVAKRIVKDLKNDFSERKERILRAIEKLISAKP